MIELTLLARLEVKSSAYGDRRNYDLGMGRGGAETAILSDLSARLAEVHLSYRQQALRDLTAEEISPLEQVCAAICKALSEAGAIGDPQASVEKGLVDFCYRAAEMRPLSDAEDAIASQVYRLFTYETPRGQIKRAVEKAVAPYQTEMEEVFETVRKRAGLHFSEQELRQHLQSIPRKQLEKGLRKVWWMENGTRAFFDPLCGERNLLEALTREIYQHAQGWSDRRDRKLIEKLNLDSFADRVSVERTS